MLTPGRWLRRLWRIVSAGGDGKVPSRELRPHAEAECAERGHEGRGALAAAVST